MRYTGRGGRLLVVACALVVAMSSCGRGGGRSGGEANGSTSTSTALGGTTTPLRTPGLPGDGAAIGGGDDSSPAGGLTGSPGDEVGHSSSGTSSGTYPVTIKLDGDCVRPGDTQGLTLTGAPGTFVAYDTVYVDGSNGLTKPRPGGSGNGRSDERGTIRVTWVMASDVPPGSADVNAVANTGQDSQMVTAKFLVKPVGHAC